MRDHDRSHDSRNRTRCTVSCATWRRRAGVGLFGHGRDRAVGVRGLASLGRRARPPAVIARIPRHRCDWDCRIRRDHHAVICRGVRALCLDRTDRDDGHSIVLDHDRSELAHHRGQTGICTHRRWRRTRCDAGLGARQRARPLYARPAARDCRRDRLCDCDHCSVYGRSKRDGDGGQTSAATGGGIIATLSSLHEDLGRTWLGFHGGTNAWRPRVQASHRRTHPGKPVGYGLWRHLRKPQRHRVDHPVGGDASLARAFWRQRCADAAADHPRQRGLWFRVHRCHRRHRWPADRRWWAALQPASNRH